MNETGTLTSFPEESMGSLREQMNAMIYFSNNNQNLS